MKQQISGSDLRRARTLANLSLRDLAYLSDVAKSSLSRLENCDGEPISCSRRTLLAITTVLKSNGVELTAGGIRTIPKEFQNGKEHSAHTGA